MKPKFHKLNDQSGVSLAETLIVVAIISIVASLAYFKMGTANVQFKRQNVARELKVAFERARFDSVKRHAAPGAASVTVTPTSYTLHTYNAAGVASDQVTTLPAEVVIARYDGTALTSSVVT